MEPIVSPWFIYLLSVADGLIVFFSIGLFIGLASLVGFHIWYNCEFDYSWVKDEKKAVGKRILRMVRRICIPFSIISLLIVLFLPGRNTIIGMYVADHITPNNVKKALVVGKDFKEEVKKDILDLIEAIQNGGDKNGDTER